MRSRIISCVIVRLRSVLVIGMTAVFFYLLSSSNLFNPAVYAQTCCPPCDLMGCPSGYFCNYSGAPEGVCTYLPPTSSCSAECRRGTSCGPGRVGASGCSGRGPNFGCRADQRCCRALNCSGGGGGCTGSNPATPVLLAPADEATFTNTAVTLQWSVSGWGSNCAGNNANTSRIYIDPCPETGPIVSPTDLDYTVPATSGTGAYTGSMVFNGTIGTSYCWRMAANNGMRQSGFTAARRFRINGGVMGTVYDDPALTCSTATPSNLGGGLTAVWGSDSATVASDGTFSIATTSTAPQTLTLTGMPSNYVCVPGCGTCPSRLGLAPPSTGNNFFFTQSRDAWWQVDGGGIYAGSAAGQSIRSVLPYPATRLLVGTTNDQAAVVKRSTVGPDLGFGTQVSDNQWIATSVYRGRTMDYDFFAAQMGVTTSAPDDWAGSSILSTGPLSTTKDFYLIRPAGGTATIDTAWSITASQEPVIFVDGDLVIDANITVASGGFLAFIVSGDVVVAPDVSNIAGIYVMDGTFTTQADDTQLTTQGSVVTWTGVSLSRDMGAALNGTTPAERFVYRPDLLENMPPKMRNFILNWQEVAPGTFNN